MLKSWESTVGCSWRSVAFLQPTVDHFKLKIKYFQLDGGLKHATTDFRPTHFLFLS